MLQEVRDPPHQEVSVFQVGKQKGHSVLGADGERTGQHVGAVCLLYDGNLKQTMEHSFRKMKPNMSETKVIL